MAKSQQQQQASSVNTGSKSKKADWLNVHVTGVDAKGISYNISLGGIPSTSDRDGDNKAVLRLMELVESGATIPAIEFSVYRASEAKKALPF